MDRKDESQQKRRQPPQEIELCGKQQERPALQAPRVHQLQPHVLVQGKAEKQTLQAQQIAFFKNEFKQVPRRPHQALCQPSFQPPNTRSQSIQAQQQAFFGEQAKHGQ